MKPIKSFILSLCFLLAASAAYGENQIIYTNFDEPLHELFLDDEWTVTFVENRWANFELDGVPDVELDIDAGEAKLDPSFTVEVLENELIDLFVNKNIPAFLQISFPGEEQTIDPGITFDPNITRHIVNGIDWVKACFSYNLKHTVCVIGTDGRKSKTLKIIPLKRIEYFTILNNRLHIVGFDCPVSLLDEMEPAFDKVLNNLYRK